MTDEKWEQLKEETERKFKVEKKGREDLLLETADGTIKQGEIEFMIFLSPLGRTKLARESKPVVLDKKFIYSHRGGDAARTEYELSDTEFTHKLKVYKWDDDEDQWSEIDAEAFSS
ncbi:MAG: hypothetical protein Q8P83_03655 [bacterium]|nr:hypothetical protein [bacterium]